MPPRSHGIRASDRHQRNTLWRLSLQLAKPQEQGWPAKGPSALPRDAAAPQSHLSLAPWQTPLGKGRGLHCSLLWRQRASPSSQSGIPQTHRSQVGAQPRRGRKGRRPWAFPPNPPEAPAALGQAGERGRGSAGSAPSQTPPLGHRTCPHHLIPCPGITQDTKLG